MKYEKAGIATTQALIILLAKGSGQRVVTLQALLSRIKVPPNPHLTISVLNILPYQFRSTLLYLSTTQSLAKFLPGLLHPTVARGQTRIAAVPSLCR